MRLPQAGGILLFGKSVTMCFCRYTPSGLVHRDLLLEICFSYSTILYKETMGWTTEFIKPVYCGGYAWTLIIDLKMHP